MDWGHEILAPDGARVLDQATFGGVPQSILTDNAKMIVSERVGRSFCQSL